jgi:hypothetical protein
VIEDILVLGITEISEDVLGVAGELLEIEQLVQA